MKKFLSAFLPIFLIFCATNAFAKTYSVTTASYAIVINNEECEFSNPILNVDVTTYLSLTEMAKLLGVEVNWNDELHQVEINAGSHEEKDYYYLDELEEESEDGYWWEWDSSSEDSYWWEWDNDSEDNLWWDDLDSTSEEKDESSYPEIDYNEDYEEEEEEDVKTSTSTTSGEFVGSKSGSKYHISTCYWVEKIKAENKIYFSSKSQAENEGYEPCSSCLK